MKTLARLGILFFSSILCLSAQNIEKGKATYYGKRFNNKKTASGIIYKKDDLVCAHKTYPFGTKLLVKNPMNNREVVVEVIDRGPHQKGRIIDLSYAAAKQLDIIHHGVAAVEVSELLDNTAITQDSTLIVNTTNN